MEITTTSFTISFGVVKAGGYTFDLSEIFNVSLGALLELSANEDKDVYLNKHVAVKILKVLGGEND
jgi:hypothetical protein